MERIWKIHVSIMTCYLKLFFAKQIIRFFFTLRFERRIFFSFLVLLAICAIFTWINNDTEFLACGKILNSGLNFWLFLFTVILRIRVKSYGAYRYVAYVAVYDFKWQPRYFLVCGRPNDSPELLRQGLASLWLSKTLPELLNSTKLPNHRWVPTNTSLNVIVYTSSNLDDKEKLKKKNK